MIISAPGEHAGRRADGSNQRRYRCCRLSRALALGNMAVFARGTDLGGTRHNAACSPTSLLLLWLPARHLQRCVNAHGGFNFAGANTLALHDVSIFVSALNSSGGDGGATAQAQFIAGANTHLSLHRLELISKASSNGGDGALAGANAQITQPAISIAGGVSWRAVNGGGACGAAHAVTISLNATTGSVTVGPLTGGAVAADRGDGNAIASDIMNVHVANPLSIASGRSGRSSTRRACGGRGRPCPMWTDPPGGGGIHVGNLVVLAFCAEPCAAMASGTSPLNNADLNCRATDSVTVTGIDRSSTSLERRVRPGRKEQCRFRRCGAINWAAWRS